MATKDVLKKVKEGQAELLCRLEIDEGYLSRKHLEFPDSKDIEVALTRKRQEISAVRDFLEYLDELTK